MSARYPADHLYKYFHLSRKLYPDDKNNMFTLCFYSWFFQPIKSGYRSFRFTMFYFI